MRAPSLIVVVAGSLAVAALAQTATRIEPKTSPNVQAEPVGNRAAPANTTAPGAEPTPTPPSNGVAPLEPKG
jgi:hypothetical protein